MSTDLREILIMIIPPRFENNLKIINLFDTPKNNFPPSIVIKNANK